MWVNNFSNEKEFLPSIITPTSLRENAFVVMYRQHQWSTLHPVVSLNDDICVMADWCKAIKVYTW